MQRLHRGSRRLAVVLLAGCGSLTVPGCSTLGRPDWLYPGPAEQQRRRAVKYDPYLQDDLGPYQFRLPLMDGSRPRDVLEPVPEVKRARWGAVGQ